VRGVVFAAVALLLASGSVVWGSWQIETVDSGQYVDAPSLAVDSSGTPHMSYRGEGTYSSGGAQPTYAFREEDGSWHIETIPGMSYCNSNSAIAIDSHDRPHVVSSTSVDWYYGTLTDTGWATQKVYQGGWNGSNCGLDMVADSNDDLHVSFTAWTPANSTGTNRVGYAFRDDGAAFSLHHDLEPNGIIGAESFVALDKNGNPAIAYKKYNSGTSSDSIRLARWNGSSWDYTTVATAATPSGMAFDAAGNLHMAYRGNYPTFGSYGDLYYARYDDLSHLWTTSLVDDTWKSSGFYAGIGLDGSGIPQIAYSAYDGSKWALRYAKASDALALSWDTETIEYGENAVLNTELVMDADFRPHIAYSGAVSGSDYVLKYATWGGSSPPVPELPPALLAAGLPMLGLCLRRFRRR